MATVTVAFDGSRRDSMDSTANVSSIGGGAGAGLEPDFVFQGTYAVSRKISTTLAGFEVDIPTSVDMTAGNRLLWIAKVIATNKDALLPVGSPAMQVRIGSDSSNYYTIDVHGNETYPLKGGWVIFPIQPSMGGAQSNATGSPAVTAVDYFAIVADFSATAKAENLAMDALDVGRGLVLTGGDGASADGTFDDFLAFDQGDAATGRFGLFTELDGILTVFGRHYIGQTTAGTATATEFTDSDKIIVFPGGLFSTTACGLFFNMSLASIVVNIATCTFLGRGRGGRVRFDTETDVDGTNEEVTAQAVIDFLEPGDQVTIRSLNGGEGIGLTNGTTYFIGKDLTATPTGVTFHTDRNDAMLESGSPGSGTPVNLTASSAGNGEIWALEMTSQSLPSITSDTSTSGSVTFDGCTFDNFFGFVGSSAMEYVACTFNRCMSSPSFYAVLTDCIMNGQNTDPGEEAFLTGTPTDISGNTFNADGDFGHALRFTSGAIGTHAFSGNTFNGYGPDAQSFDTELDVNGGTEVITITGHPYADGDPVYYGKEGGTESIGLSDANTLYYVHFIDANTISLHLNQGDALNDNSRVNLTASTSGNGETHWLYSGNAAIVNASGGTITLNITGGGNQPSYRNLGSGSLTVVNLSYALTIIVKDNDGNLLSGVEVTVVRVSDTTELYHLENTGVDGTATYSYAAGDAGTIVDILFMNVNYKPDISDIKDLTTPSQSQTINVTLFPDENYKNP